MAESNDKNTQPDADPNSGKRLNVEDDMRLRYLGFDVGPSKIGELFKSSKEQDGFLAHVREKRESKDALRDTSNFREERISASERYVILAASVAVLLLFFLPATPWISGHFETRTEVAIGSSTKPVVSDSLNTDSSGAPLDSSGVAVAATAAPTQRKTGFQELQVKRTRIKIDKTPYRLSGMQAVAMMGEVSSEVFSSGPILKITGILFVVLVLLIFAVPLFIIYSLLTVKGDADVAALKLKRALKVGWAPVLVWALMLALSVVGADYGFDSSTALNQFGESYGMGSFMGLLGSGFYLSLAGCMFAGAKAIEI